MTETEKAQIEGIVSTASYMELALGPREEGVSGLLRVSFQLQSKAGRWLFAQAAVPVRFSPHEVETFPPEEIRHRLEVLLTEFLSKQFHQRTGLQGYRGYFVVQAMRPLPESS